MPEIRWGKEIADLKAEIARLCQEADQRDESLANILARCFTELEQRIKDLERLNETSHAEHQSPVHGPLYQQDRRRR